MLQLPYELVLSIVDLLPRCDIKSLSLVNIHLNHITSTRLYKTISIPKPLFFSCMDNVMLQSPKVVENTCNLNIKVRQNNSVYQSTLSHIHAMTNIRSIKIDLKDVSRGDTNLLEYLPRSDTTENLILHLNSLLDPSVKSLFSNNFLDQYPSLTALILIFRDNRCICQFKEALESIFSSFDKSTVKDVFVVLRVDNFNEISTVKPVLQVTQPSKNNLQVYAKHHAYERQPQVAL